jgi:hypothetical protein
MKRIIPIILLILLAVPSAMAVTKKATLINDEGIKIVVPVNSLEAQGYFSLGYTLMGILGTAVEASPALFRTNLASPITSSDTSITLVNATTRDGSVLMGNYCFTIDGNISTVEYVCGVASGTAITALERGIGSDGITSYANLKFPHRYGAEIKITDFPTLQRLSNFINGTSYFPNKLQYRANIDVNGTDATTTLANIDYVNKIATSGAPNLTETVKGIGEGATRAEMSAGTATGGTGASLLVQNRYVSATPSATTTIPVTGTDGKLDQGFIDLTESFTLASTTITGPATINGTTNVASSTISKLSIETLNNNISDFGIFTATSTSATGDSISTETITLGYLPKYIKIQAYLQGRNTGNYTPVIINNVYKASDLSIVNSQYFTCYVDGSNPDNVCMTDGAGSNYDLGNKPGSSTNAAGTASESNGDIQASVYVSATSTTGFTITKRMNTGGGTFSSTGRIQGQWSAFWR